MPIDIDHYLTDFSGLVDAIVAAASTLHDMPELIERDAIVQALCARNIWDAKIRPAA